MTKQRSRWLVRLTRHLTAALLLASLLSPEGCAHTTPPKTPNAGLDVSPLSQQQHQRALLTLDTWRKKWSFRPGLMKLAVSVQRAASSYDGRGLLALQPPRRARLIILGPGGLTGVDLWLSDDTYRLAIPVRGIESRGQGLPNDDGRAFPVAMLRWWFLRTMTGTLVGHARQDFRELLVLRSPLEPEALYAVGNDLDGSGLYLVRQQQQRREVMHVDKPGCGRAIWERPDRHWRIEVRCVGWENGSRAARALRDPDQLE